jgi:hypothetical protein
MAITFCNPNRKVTLFYPAVARRARRRRHRDHADQPKSFPDHRAQDDADWQ